MLHGGGGLHVAAARREAGKAAITGGRATPQLTRLTFAAYYAVNCRLVARPVTSRTFAVYIAVNVRSVARAPGPPLLLPLARPGTPKRAAPPADIEPGAQPEPTS